MVVLNVFVIYVLRGSSAFNWKAFLFSIYSLGQLVLWKKPPIQFHKLIILDQTSLQSLTHWHSLTGLSASKYISVLRTKTLHSISLKHRFRGFSSLGYEISRWYTFWVCYQTAVLSLKIPIIIISNVTLLLSNKNKLFESSTKTNWTRMWIWTAWRFGRKNLFTSKLFGGFYSLG